MHETTFQLENSKGADQAGLCLCYLHATVRFSLIKTHFFRSYWRVWTGGLDVSGWGGGPITYPIQTLLSGELVFFNVMGKNSSKFQKS